MPVAVHIAVVPKDHQLVISMSSYVSLDLWGFAEAVQCVVADSISDRSSRRPREFPALETHQFSSLFQE